MRIIDRLTKYLEYKKITAYSFERNCKVANGYLSKQRKGKGTIGSDILERIYQNYSDLNLTWLVAGEDDMLLKIPRGQSYFAEPAQGYAREDTFSHLHEKIQLLEQSLMDKEKIILLLEEREGNSLPDIDREEFDNYSRSMLATDYFGTEEEGSHSPGNEETEKEGLPGNPSYENEEMS